MALDAGSLVFVAYPPTDPLGTPSGTLTEAYDKTVTVEDNGVGGGRFQINANSSQADWCEPGAYVLVYRDTVTTPADAIAGFWIEEHSEVLLSPDEEGGQVIAVGGRGSIAYLTEAVVWHRAVSGSRAACQPARRRWHWKDAHPARVLVRMLEEGRARNALGGVTWDFTRLRDSDGDLFTEDKADRINIPIGVNYLELVDIMRDTLLHVRMSPDLVLHDWDNYDNDLSASVGFTAGTDIQDTVTRSRKARRARSHILIERENRKGRVRHQVVWDTDIRAELERRKEGFFRFERTARRRVIRRVGRRKLRNWKREWDGAFALKIIDTTDQVALVDYTVGDTVDVHVPPHYDHEALRVKAITLTENDDGTYDPTIEFGAFVNG